MPALSFLSSQHCKVKVHFTHFLHSIRCLHCGASLPAAHGPEEHVHKHTMCTLPYCNTKHFTPSGASIVARHYRRHMGLKSMCTNA